MYLGSFNVDIVHWYLVLMLNSWIWQVVLGGLTGLGNPFKSLVEYFQHMFPAVDPSTVSIGR